MLEKTSLVDQITVGADGTVFVRTATTILDDGVEVSKTYHRETFTPGSDVSGQDQRVQDIAAVVWAGIPQPTGGVAG